MIPKKDYSTLIWIWFIVIMYLIVKHIFDAHITLGDIIVALVAIVISLCAFISSRRQPYKMFFPVEAYGYGEKRHFSKYKGIESDSPVLIMVEFKKNVSLERINIRCVDRYWLLSKIGKRDGKWKWSNSTVSVASIVDEEIKNEAVLNKSYSTEPFPDTQGGKYLVYKPPYCRGDGEKLWLSIVLEAKKNWNGYLSFKVDGCKKYARLPINIAMKRSDTHA